MTTTPEACTCPPPPLPGSREALQEAAAWDAANALHLDHATALVHLDSIRLLCVELATLGNLAGHKDELGDVVDLLDDICGLRRIEPRAKERQS